MIRGSSFEELARTKRGFAFFSVALFVLSIGLQYAVLAKPPAVSASPAGAQFQLDGNAIDDGTGDDWENIFNGTDSAIATTGIKTDTAGLRYTVGSKDTLDFPSNGWDDKSVPDKDDILHAYAALYEVSGNKVVTFGADRFSNDGTANLGFWFFQNDVHTNPDGSFSGHRTVGDVFVVSTFTSGGDLSTIQWYKWTASGLDLQPGGVECSTGVQLVCAIANKDDTDSPWAYSPKAGTSGTFPVSSFFEGGLSLDVLFPNGAPCFSTFMAETRSSDTTAAELKNFLIDNFNTCKPPTIVTTSSASTADFGGTVHDNATLSGTDGPASGSVSFFICTPNQVTAAGCPSGSGSQVGSAVPVTTSANGGTAQSANYTVGSTSAAVGKYCWRAEYTPDASSQYLAGSHTNATTECFTVAPATIAIEKTADNATVNAGDPIGFGITVTNTGTGTALGVTVSDPLPAGSGTGVTWSIDTQSNAGLCSITGSAPQTLNCGPTSLAANASFSVHVTATTSSTECTTYDNTATAASTNDGSDTDDAAITCNPAQIQIAKVANPAGPVLAGDPIGFDITVSNAGLGTATGVHVTDVLPTDAGTTWSLGAISGPNAAGVSCSISVSLPLTLTCDTASLPHDGSFSVRITSPTTAATAGASPVDNTASVTTTNDGSDQASASVEIIIPAIHAEKLVNGVHSNAANPGDVLTYSITATNSGTAAGTADISDDVTAIQAHATISDISDGGVLSAGGVITWPQFSLAVNGSKTVTFKATLNTSFPDGITTLPNAVVVVGTGSNCLPEANQDAACNTTTTVSAFQLTIDKSNNAPIVPLELPDGTTANLPTAKEGSTVTYTLSYHVGDLDVHNGQIHDVLPAGVTYVTGSATSNAEFTFVAYDAGTRTLSWHADTVTADGTLSYMATVDAGANLKSQPLTNTATIRSDETGPDEATSDVFVPAPPLPATHKPTPPPTDALAPTEPSTPGSSMLLILAALGILIVGLSFVTPVPAVVRRRNRR